MDFASEAWTMPSAAWATNCVPMSAEKLRLENTANNSAKNRETPANIRSSLGLPARRPAATAVASPSEIHPSAVVNGARRIDTQAMAAITVSPIEMPGTSATFSQTSSSSNHLAAIRPGTTSNNARANNTHSVWPRFPKIPGWSA